jgi:acyl-CoA thioester hydrolase
MCISASVEIRPRYAETDQMRAVYYGRYFEYFESGRSEVLRSLGRSYVDMEAEGIYLPVVDAYARYHSPAGYDELLVLETRLVEARGARLRFEYEARTASDGRRIATGYTTHAFTGPDRRPRRPPDWFPKVGKASKKAGRG